MLAVCLCIFSFTSILGWCYYGQVCAWSIRMRRGDKTVYKAAYLLVLAVSFPIPAQTVWNAADLLNGLMTIPNLYCLWRLRKQIPGLTVDEPGGIEDNR